MKKFDFDMGDKWNMSLMTLQRIDQLLKDCQKYSVNNNLLGLRQNMLEVYKESRPWLKKPEKVTAQKKWEKVQEFKFEYNYEEQSISYPDGLREALDDFDFWIRNKLHVHKVTFDSKDVQKNRGMAGLQSKYNL